MAIPLAGLRPSFHFILSFFTIVHILCKNLVHSDSNRLYHISKLCVRERYHPVYMKIDGAVITSDNENDLDCVLTFQTDSILQRFMLRFEELALDCNDHLFVFDGAHAFGNYKADLSCRSTRAEIGTIFTQSNFLTLKYVTDKYSKSGDGFKLVITAFKDTPSIGCSHLKCLNTFCISKDLACDNFNHCGDNSDETSHAFCYTEESDSGQILGLEFSVFIGAVLSVFVVCLICVVNLAICLCRREHQLHQQQRIALHGQTSTTTLAHPASYTGTTGATLSPGTQRYATLPLEKIRDKPPPYPGNMYCPATGNNTDANNCNNTNNSNNISGHHVIGNNSVPVQQVVYFATK